MTPESQDNSINDQQQELLAGEAHDEAFEPIARRLAEANAAVEPPPALIDRIESLIEGSAARRRMWRNTVLAAAAVLAVTVTGWVIVVSTLSPVPSPPTGEHLVANDATEPEENEPSKHTRLVRVEFNPEAQFFARPVETESPNVSIVFVYENVIATEPDDGLDEQTPPTQGSET